MTGADFAADLAARLEAGFAVAADSGFAAFAADFVDAFVADFAGLAAGFEVDFKVGFEVGFEVDFTGFAAGVVASISTTEGSAAFDLPTRTPPFPSIAGSRDEVPARSSRTSPFAGPFALPLPDLDDRGDALDSFFLLGTVEDEPVTRDFDERAEEGFAIDREG